MSQVIVYGAPNGAVGINDFKVSIRVPDGDWQDVFVYEVKVDMHDVRKASMVYFDMQGPVEVRVQCLTQKLEEAVIRPLSREQLFQQEGQVVTFTLDNPCKLVIEINGQRFSALHLFANPLEDNAPNLEAPHTIQLAPRVHNAKELCRELQAIDEQAEAATDKVLYFQPGVHYIEEMQLHIPSGTTVYIAGGAIVIGALICDSVENVTIRGRGIIYLADFHRFTAFRGLRIASSRNIAVEGIIVVDPPHYSIYLGQSEHVQIRNFKAFSTRGWSDGIDMMSCSHIDIDDIFMRNSDDCIAVYGSRFGFYGDTTHVTVRNSILWADVAHAINIGIHGDHHGDGDTIEHLTFENIDILEHHEPQENYWGAMSINAGDMNTVRDVLFDNIRVEDFELGQLIDIRVVWNKTYNPAAGRRIENITFRDIVYNGANAHPSRIFGFDEQRVAENIHFENLRINGELIQQAEQGNFVVNEYARGISFTVREQSE